MRDRVFFASAFLLFFGSLSPALFAQKKDEPRAYTLYPLSAKKQWTMEQTIYLDGKLQSGKRDIIFQVTRITFGRCIRFPEVETSISGVAAEREVFSMFNPVEQGFSISLDEIKTPNPQTSVKFFPPVITIKSGMKPGQTWTWKGIEQIGKQKRKATRKFRAYGLEQIKTPAGEFKALSVEETRPGIVTRTWYAPNVGIVKRTIRGGATKTVFLLSSPTTG